MVNMKLAAVSLFTGLAVANCGPALKDIGISKSDSSSSSDNSQEKVPVTVSVQKKDTQPQSLALLADATSFQITMDGCASGFTATATEATVSGLEAYMYDQNCLAKLDQFQFNGTTYQPSTTKPFTTWEVGDSALFESTTDATDQLSVIVVSQLNNPISGNEDVSYSFSQIAAGATASINSVGAAHVLTVSGQAAPQFSIKSVSYVGMTSTGAGQFNFVLECVVPVTGTGATAACEDVTLTDLSYELVEDTYDSTLTVDQLDSIFASGSSTIDTSTEALDAGSAAAANGGFSTKTLNGPDQLHLHPNMILGLKAGPSYQYFNVDVSTLTSSQ